MFLDEADEEWKEIAGYPGYLVSSLGRVYSLKSNKELKIRRSGTSNYQSVTVGNVSNGTQKRFTIHRLVCTTFHGPPPTDDAQAAHLDGNRDNNHAINLAWKTPSENAQDKQTHGTVAKTSVGSTMVEAALALKENGWTIKEISAALRVGTTALRKLLKK